MHFYHSSLYYAMPILNKNIRAFNSYAESPKLHNLYWLLYPWKVPWAGQRRWMQARIRGGGRRKRNSSRYGVGPTDNFSMAWKYSWGKCRLLQVPGNSTPWLVSYVCAWAWQLLGTAFHCWTDMLCLIREQRNWARHHPPSHEPATPINSIYALPMGIATSPQGQTRYPKWEWTRGLPPLNMPSVMNQVQGWSFSCPTSRGCRVQASDLDLPHVQAPTGWIWMGWRKRGPRNKESRECDSQEPILKI